MKAVAAKERKEATNYGKSEEIKGVLEQLGIDESGDKQHDCATKMKIWLIKDI